LGPISGACYSFSRSRRLDDPFGLFGVFLIRFGARVANRSESYPADDL